MTPAINTDSLALELLDGVVGAAERAGVRHLADDYRTPLDSYEQVIPFSDIEQLPCFGGNDDPTQVVDFACNATVHAEIPPWQRAYNPGSS